MVKKLAIDSDGVSFSAHRQHCFSSLTNGSLKARDTMDAPRHLSRRLVGTIYICFGDPILEYASGLLFMAVGHRFPFSLLTRQLDMPLCDSIGPTHWLWHLLNGLTLYWSSYGLCTERHSKSQ